MENKYVYSFHEGSKEMKSLLGGKGANLAEMTNIGLPVPPGFTISTKACTRFYEEGKILWTDLIEEIKIHLKEVEEKLGKTFSNEENPLPKSSRAILHPKPRSPCTRARARPKSPKALVSVISKHSLSVSIGCRIKL